MAFSINANDYRNAKGGAEKLLPGGHKCIIKKITLGKSKTNKDQFVVQFDTAADDRQPSFYMNRFVETNKWGGNYYLTAGNDYFVSNIKKLCAAVEASNDGFCGGDFSSDGSTFDFRYEDFRDVEVGIVFREEEFRPSGGTPDAYPTIAKAYYFCDAHHVLDEAVPETKRLERPGSEGFMAVPDGLADEGLPFK